MNTSRSMIFVCTTALAGVVVLGSSLEGCAGRSAGTGSGTSTGGSSSSNSSSSSGTGGTAAAQVVTIQQITNVNAPGSVGAGTPVQVDGAIAMSTKFLVSKGHSGSCLWGVFLSAPNLTTTDKYTGILALSYGTNATVSDGGTEAFCPTIQAGQPAGDSFPDDVAPGDELTVVGTADAYIPGTCTAADAGPGYSSVPEFQLDKVNYVTRTATGKPLPAPYVLTSSDLATLAAGTDADWLKQWGAVRVQIQNVSVMPYGGDAGTLEDDFGHMYLSDGLQIGDKLYYVGYVAPQDACYSGPEFNGSTSPSFASITGFVYLDFCNWDIVPSNKCFDLVPPSTDCASVVYADGGAPDAGNAAAASLYCLH